MMWPSLEIVDLSTEEPLPYPTDEDDVQYNRLFHGTWAVRLTGSWHGQVGIVLEPPATLALPLFPVKNKSDLWRIPGDEELEGYSRSKREKKEKQYEQTRGATGRLRITLLDENAQPVQGAPVKLLDVLPGNVSEEQLGEMVYDIGLLALSATSLVLGRQLSAPTEDGVGIKEYGFIWREGDGQLVLAEALQETIAVLRREIPRLRSRPLRSIRVAVGPTKAHKSTPSARLFQRPYILPDYQTTFAQMRVESLDCSENRFVLNVIRHLCILTRAIQARLDDEPAEAPGLPSRSFGDSSSKYWMRVRSVQARRVTSRVQLIQKRKDMAAKLVDSLQWLEKESRESFWSSVSQDAQPIHSLRLLGAPSYSAIYARYRAMWGSTFARVSLITSLLEHADHGRIRPDWEVYELWCFAFIYYSLLQDIRGLKPVGGELIESLTITSNGELQIPRNVPFTLEGELPSHDPLRLRLWYEPQLETQNKKRRCPDILLELSVGQSSPMYFVFDCKYRDYGMQGKKALREDVYGVARLKYLASGLRFEGDNKALDIEASFILHTSDELDYWGEVPLWKVLKDLYGDQVASERFDIEFSKDLRFFDRQLAPYDYAGHQYGAIAMCPGHSKSPQQQFRRLLYLILYYFAGEFEYCPHCGTKPKNLDEDKEVRGQGVYYLCDTCGRFWIKHFCSGPGHHRLVKLKDSFHRLSENTHKWAYTCPKCGNDLPPKPVNSIETDNPRNYL